MKKRLKSKGSKAASDSFCETQEEFPELVTLMTKIVERLEVLEKKIDQLASPASPAVSSPQAPVSYPQPSQPVNQAPQPHHGQGGRVLYKAICADCEQDCEVPFRPSQDRPVYCKECFAERKSANSGKVPADHRPVKVLTQNLNGQDSYSSQATVKPRSYHDFSHKRKSHHKHEKKFGHRHKRGR